MIEKKTRIKKQTHAELERKHTRSKLKDEKTGKIE